MTVSAGARPAWAIRIREEREARGWSQRTLVAALRMHAGKTELPTDETLLRRVKSWEAGEHQPDPFYRKLLAKAFGTVTAAIFPERGGRDAELVAASGMDTLEILTRLRGSSVDQATIDALRITVDALCCGYPHMAPADLAVEGRQWLGRITGMLDRRMTLAQHQEVLSLAGTLAELTGCVEYDMGSHASAEATRRAALSLGEEAQAPEVIGWAYEMKCWFALTAGDYRGVVQAAEAGEALAPGTRAAVQLAAQRAKAWARVGDRRQVELALDKGRAILDGMPYPDDLDNHFVVDPSKWDFYTMDCYRNLGAGSPGSTENRLARTYAEEVIRVGTGIDGQEHAPMRIAEARITLGVVAAREGDIDGAVTYGRAALAGSRKSLPSLLMVSSELASAVSASGDAAPATGYLDELRTMRAAMTTAGQPS